jgi:hypothetical protein
LSACAISPVSNSSAGTLFLVEEYQLDVREPVGKMVNAIKTNQIEIEDSCERKNSAEIATRSSVKIGQLRCYGEGESTFR